MLTRTFDKESINSVLKHPYIWPRVSDDKQDIDAFDPPMGDNHYLFEEGVLFILHPEGDDVKIHANVLPEKRELAEEAAQCALKYAFEEMNASNVVALIPQKFGTVYGFALKFMKDKGMIGDDHFLSLGVKEWAL